MQADAHTGAMDLGAGFDHSSAVGTGRLEDRGISAGQPPRCTTEMTLVLGVICWPVQVSTLPEASTKVATPTCSASSDCQRRDPRINFGYSGVLR